MDEVMLTLVQVAIGRRSPFHECSNEAQVIASITSGKLPMKHEGVVKATGHRDFLWECCCECWHRDPTGRPTMAEMRDCLSVSWH
jgi:hypothetical protein